VYKSRNLTLAIKEETLIRIKLKIKISQCQFYNEALTYYYGAVPAAVFKLAAVIIANGLVISSFCR